MYVRLLNNQEVRLLKNNSYWFAFARRRLGRSAAHPQNPKVILVWLAQSSLELQNDLHIAVDSDIQSLFSIHSCFSSATLAESSLPRRYPSCWLITIVKMQNHPSHNRTSSILLLAGSWEITLHYPDRMSTRGILVHVDKSENSSRRVSRVGRLKGSMCENDATAATSNDDGDRALVRFHEITIREYPPTIGDNPGSLKGPALSIDWHPQSEMTVQVDEYEQYRPKRRTKNQMTLSADRRWSYLKSVGFARSEIVAVTKDVNIVRRQRRRTKTWLYLSPIHELQEKIVKKIKNILSGGRIKREERHFLEQFIGAKPSPVLEESSAGQKSKATASCHSKNSAADETVLFVSDDESLPPIYDDLNEILEADESESLMGLRGIFDSVYGWDSERVIL